jgi:hypothetical protein
MDKESIEKKIHTKKTERKKVKMRDRWEKYGKLEQKLHINKKYRHGLCTLFLTKKKK